MARVGSVDEELLALLKERPGVFLQHVLWGEHLSFYNSKPVWVDEPILRETLSPEEIRLLGEVFSQRGNTGHTTPCRRPLCAPEANRELSSASQIF
jgi:hypothetical protein